MTHERSLEVLAAGPLTLVEDLGRPGLAAVGVGRSGAADRAAFRLGARLLAQGYDRAALEVTFGGLEVRARGDLTVVLTGAPAPATVDGHGVGPQAPFVLPDGAVLRLGRPPVGLRTYVAVRGGVDVPPVLGSRSRDVLAGLGPEPLARGTLLPVGPAPAGFPLVDVAPAPEPSLDRLVLRAGPGPRTDWLADPTALTRTTWTVSSRSDRVGIRLSGPPLIRADAWRDRELPSEGLVRGALQVPAGGEPVLFLADHPVTGGYPVVAVVGSADVDRAAQAVPGQPVRFLLVDRYLGARSPR
ncbi:MAG: biotin-dependent carboxyltransferase family protein [Actinomycetes bacterium]